MGESGTGERGYICYLPLDYDALWLMDGEQNGNNIYLCLHNAHLVRLVTGEL